MHAVSVLAHINVFILFALKLCQVHSFIVTTTTTATTTTATTRKTQNQYLSHFDINVHSINRNRYGHGRMTDRHMILLSMSSSSSSDDGEYKSAIFTQSKEEVHSRIVGGEDVDMRLSLDDLKKCWVELSELIEFEELMPDELDEIYSKVLEGTSSTSTSSSSPSSTDGNDNKDGKLDKKGFFAFYQSIDDLFEPPDDDDEAESEDNDKDVTTNTNKDETEVDNKTREEPSPAETETVIETIDPTIKSKEIKANLLSYLHEMTTNAKSNNKLTCGFDCTDKERQVIYDLIISLSSIISPSNMITNPNKKATTTQAMGEWDLCYTCSHAMLINRSLSGLGRSTSDKAQFQGLRKILSGSRFLGTAEYIETFGGDESSFDVVVTGEWYFEEKRHAYTGLPAPCLRMELDKVIYGPTTNGADQWSSLGPVKMTDFLYLDDDLMILRGNANTNSLFVYERV